MNSNKGKWASLLDNMSISGKKKTWLEEYANNHIDVSPTQSVNEYPSLLPISMKIAATTIGTGNGITDKDIDNATKDRERILKENRSGKIDSVLYDKDFEPKPLPDIPEKIDGLISVQPLSAPKVDLLYIDYVYGSQSKNNDNE